MSDQFPHDDFLDTTRLDDDQKMELLNIINGTITEGMKIANSLDYKAVKDDYSKQWNYIDKRKLKWVKRLAHFIEEASPVDPELGEDTL